MKKKLDIIYEDKNIIVVNKPSGLLTVSTLKEKERTLYHYVSDYVKKSNPKSKIFIIHRLDKDTSGIVMFAKHQDIKFKYQNNWDKLVTKRRYIAVVEGILKEKTGTIRSYLKETKTLFVYSSDDKVNGKLAITNYEVTNETKRYSLLNVDLKTGRKNQIRVHLSDIKHPIVGDSKYGKAKGPLNRLGLHAYELELINPINKKKMLFQAKIPKSFKDMFGI